MCIEACQQPFNHCQMKNIVWTIILRYVHTYKERNTTSTWTNNEYISLSWPYLKKKNERMYKMISSFIKALQVFFSFILIKWKSTSTNSNIHELLLNKKIFSLSEIEINSNFPFTITIQVTIHFKGLTILIVNWYLQDYKTNVSMT